MRVSPVFACLIFAIFLVAIGPSCGVSGCCSLPPPGDGSSTANVCNSAFFTACVHSCGESNTTETVAATCSGGVYSCDNSTIPAVACGQGSWTTALTCGPWVSGHDCGQQCGLCVKGLWTCGPCPDAASD